MTTFINKYSTSDNVARSTPTERRLINEQSRSHRASARTDTTSAKPVRTRGRSRSHQQETRLSSCSEMYGTQSPGTRRHFSSTHSIFSFHANKIVNIPPDTGNSLDPFHTACIPLACTTLQLLVYYQNVYYSVLWSTVSEVLSPRIDITFLQRCTTATVITEALHNDSRMLCLLASISGYMSTSLIPTSSSNIRAAQVEFLALGMESLRKELTAKSGMADNSMMMESMHLYLAAVRSGKADAAQAHSKGVKAIVNNTRRRGVHIHAARMAIFALVDLEKSVEMLKEMGWNKSNLPENIGSAATQRTPTKYL